MAITKPIETAIDFPPQKVSSISHLDEDSEAAVPKIGTTIQQGWDAIESR